MGKDAQNPAEPDWSADESDPLAFFRLASEASRVDLRRNYAALIRRFRPESHPEEFQVIRRMYETADRILNSRERSAPVDLSFIWSGPIEHRETDHRTSGRVSRSWGPDQLTEEILRIARATPSDHFYLHAGDLLLELFCLASTDEFLRLYEQVTVLVNHDDVLCQPMNRVYFLLTFLPYAAWTVPDSWLNGELQYLEQNADLVVHPLEYEFLLQALAYRSFCRQHDFERENEVLRPLHSIIVDYFRHVPSEGCRLFCDAVRGVLNDGVIFDTSLQFAHRRFLRPQLEFWCLLSGRVSALLNLPPDGGLHLQPLDFLRQWTEFAGECEKRLKPAPEYRRLRWLMATGENSEPLGCFIILKAAIYGLAGAFVMFLGGFLLLAFTDGIHLPEPQVIVRFGAVIGATTWMLFWGIKVAFRLRYGPPKFVSAALQPALLQKLYCNCVRQPLITCFLQSRMTMRQFGEQFAAQLLSTAVLWQQTPEFVSELVKVSNADPAIWWLESTLPFRGQH